MIRVVAHTPAHAVEVRSLRGTFERSTDPRGAVVMLDGSDGWPRRGIAALAGGARALVIDRPSIAPERELDELVAVAGSAPIVLARSVLRHDELLGRHEKPAAIELEVASTPAELPALLGDALGWARSALGEALSAVTVERASGAVLVLCEGQSSRLPVTALVTLLASDADGPRLRATVLGEERWEFVCDGAAMTSDRAVVTERGRAVRPVVYESALRAALRRVARALDGEAVTDLADFRADAVVVARVTRDSTHFN